MYDTLCVIDSVISFKSGLSQCNKQFVFVCNPTLAFECISEFQTLPNINTNRLRALLVNLILMINW